MLKIVQARSSLGSSNPGTEHGPAAILDRSFLAALNKHHVAYHLVEPVEAVASHSDSSRHGLKNYDEVIDMTKRLYQRVVHDVHTEDQLLTLGGDHSIGMGSMLAAKAVWPELKLVYIDAHPDCHPKPQDTTSGNIHGFPVSTALGDGLFAEFGDIAHYNYDQIAFLGLKDIDTDEQQYITQHSMLYITMDNIIEHGLGQAMTKILEFCGTSPMQIVVDIDSIDVSEAPATGIINKGGLTYREISYICRKLSALKIKAIDIVEVNPSLDHDGRTIELAAELGMTLLGGSWTSYDRYLVNKKPLQSSY